MELYDLLECDKESTAQELKKAYYRLSKAYHPDHNPDDPEAEEKFKKISEAYQILKDPAKRRLYDTSGIIIDESEEQMMDWARSTFSQMVEVWIKAKLEKHPIDSFPEYVLDRIKENRQTALDNIAELENKLKQLEKYENFAKVSEGENFVSVAVKRISDEINSGLQQSHTLVYRADKLKQEFERYEFSSMEDDAAMELISMFGTGGFSNMSTGSTVNFRKHW